jgi:hypothetical protein
MTILILSFVLFSNFIIDKLPFDFQWAYYDIANSSLLLFISILVYTNIDYKRNFDKTGSLSLIVVFFLSLFESIFSNFVYWEYTRIIVQTLMALFVFLLLSKILYLPRDTKRIKVDNNKVYYCRNYGKNFIGVLASLFYYPYGKAFIICNGCIYKFGKDGIYTKTNLKNVEPHYDVKELCDFDYNIQNKLESKIGDRWSILNNCFKISNEIKEML